MKKIRLLALALLTLLPWALKKQLLSRIFGYRFAAGARIGFAFVDVQNLEMAANSSIGSFTMVRNLTRLHLGECAKVGTFNWIFGMVHSGTFFLKEENRQSALILGNHSAITSRHLIDCIDTIEIGSFTTIAGFRSQFLTHSIDVAANRQACAPIRVGNYCFIGTGVVVLKGCVVPDCCVVAAGSVVGKSLTEPRFIYGGNPVQKIRAIDSSSEYFNRTVGRVG